MRRRSLILSAAAAVIVVAVTPHASGCRSVTRGRAASATATGDTAVRPFTIHCPMPCWPTCGRGSEGAVPEPLQGDGWTHGTDIRYLKELIAYWRDRFDWRAQEKRLNAFEQFTTNIDGLNVHFIHRRSKAPNALPLLITHGWPGSFVEFTRIIGPLTDPVAHGGRAEDAFDVVMPSIPGFAFSDKPREPGWDPARIAALEAKLMARLGYQRYGAQGGDWGSIISMQVALADPTRVAGLHLNMCFGNAPAGTDPDEGLTDPERARLKERQAFQAEETGYQQIQGTKPQTLGTR
jgi:microsomal epoxide hydrolase